MGRLIEPVGNYAKKPYYIVQTGISVYCVEELCFVLCRYPFLLDRGILDKSLVKWLDEECGLRALAGPLHTLLRQNGSPSALVGTILDYVNYGTKKERQETEELLRRSADMDASARRKSFADYLVENGKYAQAVEEYEKIEEEIPAADNIMQSEILHNKGVALCRLFSFEEAAQAFLEACQKNGENQEAAVHYLGALRMSLSEEDYISFIADNKEWYEASLELEKRLENIQREYEAFPSYQELSAMLTQRNIGYYQAVSERLAGMKEEYREMVAKP